MAVKDEKFNPGPIQRRSGITDPEEQSSSPVAVEDGRVPEHEGSAGSVSVALAACNGARFIGEQLESILLQSVPPGEIVVCDDASEDDTVAVVEKFRRRVPGVIRLFRNPERLGVSGNFERAIGETRGDVVFLSDQDDVWLPRKIERMMQVLMTGAGGVFSDSAIVDESLHDSGVGHWSRRGFPADLLGYLSGGRLERLRIFLRRVPAAGHDMAFRSSLKSLLLPFPKLPMCHDTWIGMVLAVLNLWSFTGEKLTLFRQHGENISASGANLGWLEQYREAKRSVEENSFAWNAELYRQLLERLAGRCPPEVEALLHDRREHSLARAAMNCGFYGRVPLVLREMRNGRYFRYGRGWKSVLQDLFLRGSGSSCGQREE